MTSTHFEITRREALSTLALGSAALLTGCSSAGAARPAASYPGDGTMTQPNALPGAAAARYIDAFFANVNWDVVNARLERAQQAHAALRGAG